jgi:hypothetical protein
VQEAIHWYRRALAEQPKAIWINRFLASSYALAGSKEQATRVFPELTVQKVRASLPHPCETLERYAEGLAAAGLVIG